VLSQPILGLTIRNPYFEPVGLDYLTATITADGPLPAATILAELRDWSIHPWLLGQAG
jgi:hypothetical protein